MAEILGLGVTHSPPLARPDSGMAGILDRVRSSRRVPESFRQPDAWPEPMQCEWAANANFAAAAEHRARQVEGFRRVRKALDDFAPDFVLIFGDDQYENFREDGVPPFCVFALDEVESRPFAMGFLSSGNVWNADAETRVRTRGHAAAARYLAAKLLEAGFDTSYAYRMRHELGMPHAFINTLLFLDYDRTGLDYPVVPFHVNCYGSSVLSKRGAFGHLEQDGPVAPDPPSPSPARCFAIGAATASALAQSPWRVAMIASSSWSHAFLVEKHHYLWPDVEADRARYEELRDGQLARWRGLTTAELEASGQQELLNWVCLAGAMDHLGQRAAWSDFVETWIFNASKCFAVFPPR
ncbi:MAG: extradiol ring-cleavage dioxygenase [Proteobacteria bacterium]|nr:extradiol ring-cleavage dioxygenase [Pseudomonadota bacterium]